LFPVDSGAADGKTNALDAIWTDMADFETKLANLQIAAAALANAADTTAVGAGMRALGSACQACHETYRKPLN
jgi:cytochrome c556